MRPGIRRVGGNYFPQLDHSLIEKFIREHSVAIGYWKATICACYNHDTGQPNILCHNCRGLGWYYGEKETEEKYLRAQVISRTSKQLDRNIGTVFVGTVSITFLPGVVPADGDLIQVSADVAVVNNEFHAKGSRLSDGSTAEVFRFRDIICVEKVFVYRDQDRIVQELPSDQWELNQEKSGIHFKAEVGEGTKYSVRYTARPEFVVEGHTAKPFLRVAHDEGLPMAIRFNKDVVYPFNAYCVRLDRAILQRQRGLFGKENPGTFAPQDVAEHSPFR